MNERSHDRETDNHVHSNRFHHGVVFIHKMMSQLFVLLMFQPPTARDQRPILLPAGRSGQESCDLVAKGQGV